MWFTNAAFVGWTGSRADYTMILDTIFHVGPVSFDDISRINLHDGRDFLDEDFEYDLVIVGFVFHCQEPFRCVNRQDNIRLSPKHSRDAWRTRLLDCNAEQIVLFGQGIGMEVDGRLIGSLPGYGCVERVINKVSMWQYTKEVSHEQVQHRGLRVRV